jgi:hypothetical protein
MSRYSMRGAEWQAVSRLVKERDDYTCQVCGSIDDLTVDHIIPLSKLTRDQWNDGLHLDPGNLRTLCRTCNGTKSAKTLVRVSWINDQVLALLPPGSVPAFLSGARQSTPSLDFHANDAKTSVLEGK